MVPPLEAAEKALSNPDLEASLDAILGASEKRRNASLESENVALRSKLSSAASPASPSSVPSPKSSFSPVSKSSKTASKQAILAVENMRAANAILTESVKSLTAKKSSLEVALAAEVEERRKLAVAQADITDKMVAMGDAVVAADDRTAQAVKAWKGEKAAWGEKEITMVRTWGEREKGLLKSMDEMMKKITELQLDREEKAETIRKLKQEAAGAKRLAETTVKEKDAALKAAKIDGAKNRKEKASARMVAAGLQRDLDESLRITNHLRGENKRLVENTGGAGKEVERLRAENQRLTAAFADQEERRAEDKARMEGKVEELEAELMRSQLGKRVAETKAAAIGKDLGRTRAQLEGVQEQSGRVQENMRQGPGEYERVLQRRDREAERGARVHGGAG
ncbi:hypothetical protein TeGR_g11833 [Tetraparma gracilis]|uniref:Uncharacterized protein n=1 Tax=Tetraparma gracilis TaxID=2962635 RepID=A0ABQ6NAN6_9STRA|nr:hypothetical protein TeGR_g11833 [Tetraparma gracilis]